MKQQKINITGFGIQQECVPKIKPERITQEKIELPRSNPEIITCPYKGNPREIFTSTCIWHRREKDPECFKQKCPRVALKM